MDIVHVELKEQKKQSVCVKSLENKKVVNVIVDYILKSNDERVVVNDYIENDPLSENNLDKTLYLVNEIRLLSLQKTIWLYTGYTIYTCEYLGETIFTFNPSYYHLNPLNGRPIKVDDKAFFIKQDRKRIEIIKNIDVLIDGEYKEQQRDITLPWVGSSNQKVINVKKSLQKGEIVLWQT